MVLHTSSPGKRHRPTAMQSAKVAKLFLALYERPSYHTLFVGPSRSLLSQVFAVSIYGFSGSTSSWPKLQT